MGHQVVVQLQAHEGKIIGPLKPLNHVMAI
jgi:hypothetical protein